MRTRAKKSSVAGERDAKHIPRNYYIKYDATKRSAGDAMSADSAAQFHESLRATATLCFFAKNYVYREEKKRKIILALPVSARRISG